MKKITLYIGLNDKDSKIQEINTVDAYKIVTNVFTEATGGATIYEGRGVYTHNNGEIVQETTLICIVYDADISTVKRAADFLKVALNQESIAIETAEINSEFY